MIIIQSRVHVEQVGGMDIFNFMINPCDRNYQRWWPGMHLEFHTLKHVPGRVGSIVYMDEYVGERRIKMKAVVTEAEPGKLITWQMKKLIRLPVRLYLELEDDQKGVLVTHTIRAGYEGIGSILDVFFRLYLSDRFEKAMDEHAQTEFPKLGELLLSDS